MANDGYATNRSVNGTDPRMFRDRRTARFASGARVKEFQSFDQQARKRLRILFAADSPKDLMLLSSNHFEALGGDRSGQFSIRINRQWRICFEWPPGRSTPYHIEIVDYH
ncbi:MAG: type II toxin-antitoxin system RelE/ParE family toxin [Chloroflexota bacterium]|nr:type II toxin-antitoxin system RelE/ParE family toxin [Chloroflexota bacterium]